MDKIKNYIKEHQWVDIALIITFMLIFSLLFGKHFQTPLTDRGRELFLPEQLLNGYVPYKDILMIYFPTAYYINAIIYKIFGVSIDSLFFSQIFFATIYVIIFYFLSREFLNRKIALPFIIFIISSCIFCVNDLFNIVTPYSYAMGYGIMTFGICTFALVKLFRTDNLKYAYLSGFFAGLCASLKMEFITVLFLLIISLILYKKLKIKEYIKIFLSFCIIPITVLCILFIQGVTLGDITEILGFANVFSRTSPMTEFLTNMGMYPDLKFEKCQYIVNNMLNLVQIIAICILGLFLHKKYKQIYILPIISIIIFAYYFDREYILYYWLGLPIIMLLLFCTFFKQLKEQDRAAIVLLLSGLLLSQRVFFCLSMMIYGTFYLPLLILGLCVLLSKFGKKSIFDIKVDDIMIYVFVMLTVLYTAGLFVIKGETFYPVKSARGTIYTKYSIAKIINETNSYIKTSVSKDASILVLPEGNLINFMTKRNVDLKCYMLDRLYYEAYGEDKSKQIIDDTNSDYILITNSSVYDFLRPFLYSLNNPLTDYIYDNYTPIKKIYGQPPETMTILKKMTPNEKEYYMQHKYEIKRKRLEEENSPYYMPENINRNILPPRFTNSFTNRRFR